MRQSWAETGRTDPHIGGGHPSGRPSLAISLLALLTAVGCETLPDPPPQPEVFALPPAESGRPAELASEFMARHEAGTSGFIAVTDNREALEWRLALVEEATTSLDLQYFIWQGDEASTLLFLALWDAAERGVRVRLLIDDFLLTSKDHNLAGISRHPNFEIKLYNPGRVRTGTLSGLGEFLLNFRDLNRRMHNKLFIVDGRVAIVGGRNIGNPYFGISTKYNFIDLDALVTGPIVAQLLRSFDLFWNAEISYPTAAIDLDASGEKFHRDLVRVKAIIEGDELLHDAYVLEPHERVAQLEEIGRRFLPGHANFLQDDPHFPDEEDDPNTDEEYRLLQRIRDSGDPVRRDFLMVTPYLIPDEETLRRWEEGAAAGTRIRIITSTLGSNNHTSAHSHYKKYRRRILEMGAQLFEVHHNPPPELKALTTVPPFEPEFISLHVKTIMGDGERCILGSLNVDPRAIEINTETALYIHSVPFCSDLTRRVEKLTDPEISWEVFLDEKNRIRWRSAHGVVSRQPARGFGQRISDFFFRLLPIESQL